MQKYIKTITEYLVKQQRNILKVAIVLTGFIVLYGLLLLPNSTVPKEKDSLTPIISISDSEVGEVVEVDVNVIEDDVEVPERVELDEVTVVPSRVKLPVISNMSLETVRSFFDSYNARDFETACGILSLKKCDPESSYAVNRLAAEHGKMVNGYEDVSVWLAEDTEGFHSEVVCVKYSYQYKSDLNKKRVYERMSFYVKEDADGKDKITNRICEKKFAETVGEVPCPILSKRDFCLE